MADILFVDGDPQVFTGFRHAVSVHRGHWTVGWARNGAEAVAYLAGRREVDVLVADVQEPGDQCRAFLEQVRRDFPATARIVLSGYAYRDTLISAGGAAQQFVVKPFSPPTLIATLDSILGARSLLRDARLRSILGGPEALPSPPSVCSELAALSEQPDSTVAEIARLIERDLSTTAELLHLVNCSFYGLANEITSVSRAVTLLGLDVIQALVLAGAAFRPSHTLPPDLDPSEIAAQGLRACLALPSTAAATGMDEPRLRQLSVGALLRDVGLLSLAANQPESWAEYVQATTMLPAGEAQVHAFGCTVGRASAYLLALWGFHAVTVNAVAGQPIELDDDLERVNASTPALAIAEAHDLVARTAPSAGVTP